MNRFDREISHLAWPALGALIAEPLYIVSDTAVVGHIGTTELAGLAIASAALLAGYSVFIFLAYGTTAAVSRLLGAGRHEEATYQGIQGMWLAALIGVPLAIAVATGAQQIVRILGAGGDVAVQAEIYLRISAFGIPGQLLGFAGVGFLRGKKDTRIPLLIAVGAAVTNLAVELVLIFGLGFGIGASAFSTVIAQTGSAAALLFIVVRSRRGTALSILPDWPAIKALARTGGDLLVRTLALRGTLTVLTAVAARIGEDDVAAHEVAFALWSLLSLALDSVAIAGQSLIGGYLGASDGISARAVGTRILQVGLIAGLAATVLVIVTRPWLPAMFTDDPDVQKLASFLLLFVAVLQPLNAIAYALDGLLIGAGDMRFLAKAMVGAATFTIGASILVLISGAGIGWVWATIATLMTLRVAILGARWRGSRWVRLGA